MGTALATADTVLVSALVELTVPVVTPLASELRRRHGRYGLATACIGGGQGIAMVIESLA